MQKIQSRRRPLCCEVCFERASRTKFVFKESHVQRSSLSRSWERIPFTHSILRVTVIEHTNSHTYTHIHTHTQRSGHDSLVVIMLLQGQSVRWWNAGAKLLRTMLMLLLVGRWGFLGATAARDGGRMSHELSSRDVSAAAAAAAAASDDAVLLCVFADDSSCSMASRLVANTRIRLSSSQHVRDLDLSLEILTAAVSTSNTATVLYRFADAGELHQASVQIDDASSCVHLKSKQVEYILCVYNVPRFFFLVVVVCCCSFCDVLKKDRFRSKSSLAQSFSRDATKCVCVCVCVCVACALGRYLSLSLVCVWSQPRSWATQHALTSSRPKNFKDGGVPCFIQQQVLPFFFF